MSNTEDHRWDLSEREDGYLPENDEAFEQKFQEWPVREYAVWFANRC